MSKKGRLFERAVAEVIKAMDSKPTVRQSEWVVGPDGRLEMDVLVTGTTDGQERTVLIECKDFAAADGEARAVAEAEVGL